MKRPCALVVDDDDSIRWMVRTMLESMGYAVTEAERVQDAIEIVRKARATLKLIVTDYEMPGATGVTLIREVISMSGEPPTMILFTGMDLDQTSEIRSLRAEVQGRYPIHFAAKGGEPREIETLFVQAKKTKRAR
jgi:CheY-like chemotaxis protein